MQKKDGSVIPEIDRKGVLNAVLHVQAHKSEKFQFKAINFCQRKKQKNIVLIKKSALILFFFWQYTSSSDWVLCALEALYYPRWGNMKNLAFGSGGKQLIYVFRSSLCSNLQDRSLGTQQTAHARGFYVKGGSNRCRLYVHRYFKKPI